MDVLFEASVVRVFTGAKKIVLTKCPDIVENGRTSLLIDRTCIIIHV